MREPFLIFALWGFVIVGIAIFWIIVVFCEKRGLKNLERHDSRLVCQCGNRGKIVRQVAHFGQWPADYIFARCNCGSEWSFRL